MSHVQIRILLAAIGAITLLIGAAFGYHHRDRLGRLHGPGLGLVAVGGLMLVWMATWPHGFGIGRLIVIATMVALVVATLGMASLQFDRPLYPIAVLLGVLTIFFLSGLNFGVRVVFLSIVHVLAIGVAVTLLSWVGIKVADTARR